MKNADQIEVEEFSYKRNKKRVSLSPLFFGTDTFFGVRFENRKLLPLSSADDWKVKNKKISKKVKQKRKIEKRSGMPYGRTLSHTPTLSLSLSPSRTHTFLLPHSPSLNLSPVLYTLSSHGVRETVGKGAVEFIATAIHVHFCLEEIVRRTLV